MLDVVGGKVSYGPEHGAAPFHVASAGEAVVVIHVGGQSDILGEALVTVLALEGLLQGWRLSRPPSLANRGLF